MFRCIYCRKSEPDVAPSDAHIFPDAIGGVASSSQTVCVECNHIINRCVESPVVGRFTVLNLNWGIRGRRGDIRGVRGQIEFSGKTVPVTFGEAGKPRHAGVLVENNGNGKITYYVVGAQEEVQKKCREIEARHGQTEWHEIDFDSQPKPNNVFRLDVKPASVEMRRLAAKVAFERWAQTRGADLALQRQFDTVRDFVLSGKEAAVYSGLPVDDRMLCMFSGCCPPQHLVALFSHPQSPVLGAIVFFYGIFYYWVILSARYDSMGPSDDVLVENPVNRESDTPRLRKKLLGQLCPLPWGDLQREFAMDPKGVAEKATEYALKRLNGEM